MLAIAAMTKSRNFFCGNIFGVTSIERHLTLDRNMYGSDQSASIELNEIKDLVKGIRNIEKSMGDGFFYS